MEPWLFPNMCVGVILALVTLEGKQVFLGYREADVPQRELANEICNDTVHVISKMDLAFQEIVPFFSLEVFNQNQPLCGQALMAGCTNQPWKCFSPCYGIY